jgi:hypothetical protein
MTLRFSFASFVFLLVTSPLWSVEQGFESRVFGGPENLAILKNAESATACILTPLIPREKTHSDDERISNPNLYAQGSRVSLSPAQLKKLKSILLDPTNDDPNLRKACRPLYHVRFTFDSKGKPLDVDLCLECDILATSRQGKQVGGGHFDPAHKSLTKICQALFPDDEVLKRIIILPAQ